MSNLLLTLSQIKSHLASSSPRRLNAEGLTPAAVLVPLVSTASGLDILLTKRTDLVEHHKGQISFPGGAMDKSDGGAVATALREANEEIGLDPTTVEVLGFCDGLETPTGFAVTPVVGHLAGYPDLRINAEEVESVFSVPVDFFLDSKNEVVSERVWRGKKLSVYSFEYRGHRIWGATAWVIRTFLRGVAPQDPNERL